MKQPRALVVNCSAPRYSLGARKLADWLKAEGWTVEESRGDPGLFGYDYELVCLSVIFSWHAPLARDIALRYRNFSEVWCGGPGMFALGTWWQKQTGLPLQKGLDARFERQRGSYLMTFASRGCPVGCWFCIVPKLEGTDFTLDWDFTPAPILCDNNLSALPADFQEHILRRYRETAIPLMDANSGFEPRTFDGATYARWKPLLRGPWRFAYDEMSETDDVRRMLQLLEPESPRRKQVYVLAGNEPIEDCYARAERVIAWGGEPHCQFVLPLNWLGDPSTLRPRHDWSYQLSRDFCRFYNRRIWRTCSLQEYNDRNEDTTPFAGIAPRVTSVPGVTQ